MGGKALNGRRIPVLEATALFEKMLLENDLGRKTDKMLLCGSVRRCKKTCGDLDIVFIDSENDAIKGWLLDNYGTKKNGKPQTTILYEGVQVEFYEATPKTWGSSVLMWTGPAFSNIQLRKAAKKKGLKLSQHGLFDGKSNIAAGKAEYEIFEMLGKEFKEPHER
jgi:DNA polymerase (family 10)